MSMCSIHELSHIRSEDDEFELNPITSDDYDPSLFLLSPIPDDWICSICQSVTRQPLNQECAHLHCKQCLIRLQQTGRDDVGAGVGAGAGVGGVVKSGPNKSNAAKQVGASDLHCIPCPSCRVVYHSM